MFKKINVLLLVVSSMAAFASTTTPLASRDEYRVGRGDLETQFRINTSILRGDVKNEVFDIALGGNYFINDILAPGLLFQVQDAGTTNVRLLPNIKAYFPMQSKLMPFAQVGLGFSRQSEVNGLDVNLGFGANYLLSNTVAVGIQFNYDLVAGDNVIHTISFPIGFSIYFRL